MALPAKEKWQAGISGEWLIKEHLVSQTERRCLDTQNLTQRNYLIMDFLFYLFPGISSLKAGAGVINPEIIHGFVITNPSEERQKRISSVVFD